MCLALASTQTQHALADIRCIAQPLWAGRVPGNISAAKLMRAHLYRLPLPNQTTPSCAAGFLVRYWNEESSGESPAPLLPKASPLPLPEALPLPDPPPVFFAVLTAYCRIAQLQGTRQVPFLVLDHQLACPASPSLQEEAGAAAASRNGERSRPPAHSTSGNGCGPPHCSPGQARLPLPSRAPPAA